MLLFLMAGLHIHGDEVLSLSWLWAAWVQCRQELGVEEDAGGAEKKSSLQPHAPHCLYVGGTLEAAVAQRPPGRSEHNTGLLCSIHTMSKDVWWNFGAKDSVILQLATESPKRDGCVAMKAVTVVMVTFPTETYHNKPRTRNREVQMD